MVCNFAYFSDSEERQKRKKKKHTFIVVTKGRKKIKASLVIGIIG